MSQHAPLAPKTGPRIVQDAPPRQLTVAEQHARAAHLESLYCPGCHEAAVLYEAAPAHDVQPAWLGCKACPWQGTEKQGEGEGLSEAEVKKLMKRPIKPEGGSGNGGGRKKPMKRGERRPDQDPPGGGPEKAKTTTEVVEKKDQVVGVRLSCGEKVLALALAGSHECTVSDLLLWGLRLANCLPPPAWWDLNTEAQRRGMAPEGLLAHAVTAWWTDNVRETLG